MRQNFYKDILNKKIASQLLYGNPKEKLRRNSHMEIFEGKNCVKTFIRRCVRKKLRHNFWNGITNEKVLYHSDVEILDKKISVKKRDYNLEKSD